jgi:type VI secretion system secreted protein VgrG
MVRITAPNHVLLTAAGAAIELKGGDITLKGPGKVEFKASMKELAGPGQGQQSLELKKPGELEDCKWKS